MAKKYFKIFALSLAVLFVGISNLSAQVVNPVKWEFKTKSLGSNEFELQIIGDIEPHWHVYSQTVGEPVIPTSFMFKPSKDYELVGKTEEPEGVTVDDPVFQMKLKYFEDEVIFRQKVKLLSAKATVLGDFEFMTCDDKTCIPPEIVEFEFNLEGDRKETSAEQPKEESKPITISVSGDHQPEQNQGVLTPATWESKVVDLGDGMYELQAIATIDEHWHVYSMDIDGPQASEFNILKPEGLKPVEGPTENGKLIEEMDPNFDMVLGYYENTVTFSQKVKVEGSQTILAEVYFMVCNQGKCIPPEAVELEYKIGEKNEVANIDGNGTEGAEKEEGRNLWTLLLLSFGGGLAALLTPCVFPMIPMTVSFFTKQSKTKAEGIKKGIVYGSSIIIIYVLLSVPFHIFDTVSPDIFNEFSTNPYLNFFFFLVFIVFSISFLGAFEITMPSSWVNKADSASDKGGLIGVFFMALTLILVSFSCTGPAIGLLLGSVLSTDGGATALSVGMLGFGLGIGLPFGLFAAFPGWLNSLPKSGGWLNTVKVIFGFVELAFAFKFLSNADLVLQAHVITREVFLAIWIGVFGAMAMYLFGMFRLPHDSPLEKLSVGRGLFAIFTLVFTIYLLPGLWGAPLKLISGFPPPAFYSESPNGVGFSGKSAAVMSSDASSIPEGTDPDHCPHNLNCFHDYELGLAYAKEVGKPVMLDFTGWACVNCRRMEENVWSDPRVLERLRNDYVLISLYVDEKQKLPEEDQFISDVTGKKVKTVGNKWSEFQIRKFKSNTQPYYVVLDHEEKQLHEHAAYDPDIPKFIDWLERGKKIFEEGK
ncbi:thioredoxin family protein [bacterium SCSIO 12643]|nr:thioredoxin family protein [bacterium SCSIO 12643]